MRSKNNKAVGIDMIANEILKSDKVIELLHKLFDKLFENGQAPTMWRQSLIHPIPKGSNKLVQPLLYRGLALQSCIYKIYSSLLNERIGSYLEGEDLISEMQNRFRRNRSCNQHLFVINELTQIRLDENKSTFLCFVDFRKAFDYVDRDLLLVKLAELGICGKGLQCN